MQLTLFLVRHRYADLYLPDVATGKTRVELASPSQKRPRVFNTYKGASQAMHAWAKGIQTGRGYWESGDSFTGNRSDSYYVLSEIKITPVPYRRLDDLCVVRLSGFPAEVVK